jgi:multiple sugar transport system ATP-binding protein
VNDLSPPERDVAMVFQFPVIYPGTTVRENLEFPLKQRGYPKNEISKRVSEIAEMLKIQAILEEDASNLNVSERQRVALGRALVRSPKVLLLDEALTNLDTPLKLAMISELKRLHEELRQTTIYVTHDQSEAMMLADRIAVLNLGVLQQYDTPEKLYDLPKNLFVGGFIGSPAMEFLECIFDGKTGAVSVYGFHYDVSGFKKLIEDKATSSELVLGVRPEHIVVHRACGKKDHMKGKVDVVEFIGDYLSLDVVLNGRTIKVLSLPGETIEAGNDVCIELTKFYLFDKKTEEVICRWEHA